MELVGGVGDGVKVSDRSWAQATELAKQSGVLIRYLSSCRCAKHADRKRIH